MTDGLKMHHETLCVCDSVDEECEALKPPMVTADWLTMCPEGGEHDWKSSSMVAGITRAGRVCSKCKRRRMD